MGGRRAQNRRDGGREPRDKVLRDEGSQNKHGDHVAGPGGVIRARVTARRDGHYYGVGNDSKKEEANE